MSKIDIDTISDLIYITNNTYIDNRKHFKSKSNQKNEQKNQTNTSDSLTDTDTDTDSNSDSDIGYAKNIFYNKSAVMDNESYELLRKLNECVKLNIDLDERITFNHEDYRKDHDKLTICGFYHYVKVCIQMDCHIILSPSIIKSYINEIIRSKKSSSFNIFNHSNYQNNNHITNTNENKVMNIILKGTNEEWKDLIDNTESRITELKSFIHEDKVNTIRFMAINLLRSIKYTKDLLIIKNGLLTGRLITSISGTILDESVVNINMLNYLVENNTYYTKNNNKKDIYTELKDVWLCKLHYCKFDQNYKPLLNGIYNYDSLQLLKDNNGNSDSIRILELDDKVDLKLKWNINKVSSNNVIDKYKLIIKTYELFEKYFILLGCDCSILGKNTKSFWHDYLKPSLKFKNNKLHHLTHSEWSCAINNQDQLTANAISELMNMFINEKEVILSMSLYTLNQKTIMTTLELLVNKTLEDEKEKAFEDEKYNVEYERTKILVNYLSFIVTRLMINVDIYIFNESNPNNYLYGCYNNNINNPSECTFCNTENMITFQEIELFDGNILEIEQRIIKNIINYLIKEGTNYLNSHSNSSKDDIKSNVIIDKLIETMESKLEDVIEDIVDSNSKTNPCLYEMIKLLNRNDCSNKLLYMIRIVTFLRKEIHNENINMEGILNKKLSEMKYQICYENCKIHYYNHNGKKVLIDKGLLMDLNELRKYKLGIIKNNDEKKSTNLCEDKYIKIGIINMIANNYDLLSLADIDGYIWNEYIFYCYSSDIYIMFVNKYKKHPYRIIRNGIVINGWKELLTNIIIRLENTYDTYLELYRSDINKENKGDTNNENVICKLAKCLTRLIDNYKIHIKNDQEIINTLDNTSRQILENPNHFYGQINHERFNRS